MFKGFTTYHLSLVPSVRGSWRSLFFHFKSQREKYLVAHLTKWVVSMVKSGIRKVHIPLIPILPTLISLSGINGKLIHLQLGLGYLRFVGWSTKSTSPFFRFSFISPLRRRTRMPWRSTRRHPLLHLSNSWRKHGGL